MAVAPTFQTQKPPRDIHHTLYDILQNFFDIYLHSKVYNIYVEWDCMKSFPIKPYVWKFGGLCALCIVLSIYTFSQSFFVFIMSKWWKDSSWAQKMMIKTFSLPPLQSLHSKMTKLHNCGFVELTVTAQRKKHILGKIASKSNLPIKNLDLIR